MTDPEWDAVAAGWSRWWQTIEVPSHAVSVRLLELARVDVGHHVLDIATGLGEPALTAAQRVGASGRVVAVDPSPRMLHIARERAERMELANVRFVEATVEGMEFAAESFDAILCRWGVTSLPQLPRTLTAVRRWLRPNGRFASADWERGPRARPLASMAAPLAHRMFGTVDTGDQTVAVTRSETSVAETLTAAMRAAGFDVVHSEEHTLVLSFRSVDDCVQYLRDVSPEMQSLLGDRTAEELRDFTQRLADALQPFTSGDGTVRIPNVTRCTVGYVERGGLV